MLTVYREKIDLPSPGTLAGVGAGAGAVAGVEAAVAFRLLFGVLFSFSGARVEWHVRVEDVDCCEYTLATVSTVLAVDDRFGIPGKFLRDWKSHDMAFFGVGRGDGVSEGT